MGAHHAPIAGGEAATRPRCSPAGWPGRRGPALASLLLLRRRRGPRREGTPGPPTAGRARRLGSTPRPGAAGDPGGGRRRDHHRWLDAGRRPRARGRAAALDPGSGSSRVPTGPSPAAARVGRRSAGTSRQQPAPGAGTPVSEASRPWHGSAEHGAASGWLPFGGTRQERSRRWRSPSAPATPRCPALRAAVEEKIGRLSRYLEDMDRADVHFTEERNPRIADKEICEVTLEGHGHHVRCKVAAPDGFAAIDAAVNKLEHQLHKLKTKVQQRRQRGAPRRRGGSDERGRGRPASAARRRGSRRRRRRRGCAS